MVIVVFRGEEQVIDEPHRLFQPRVRQPRSPGKPSARFGSILHREQRHAPDADAALQCRRATKTVADVDTIVDYFYYQRYAPDGEERQPAHEDDDEID